MKNKAAVVVLFSLLLLFVVFKGSGWKSHRHALVHEWAPSTINISLPIASNAQKNGSLLRSDNIILYETPPSQKQVLLKIKRLREIKDFNVNGWFITFKPTLINVDPDRIQIVFRAIAERPGKARYSYRVSESQGDSESMTVITVEHPVLMSACADGSESNAGYCADRSYPR
jgi:hypothetical protein